MMAADSCSDLHAKLLNDQLTTDNKIDILARLIDAANQQALPKEIEFARKTLEDIASKELTNDEQARLHYCLGNAWYSLYDLTEAQTSSKWVWELPTLEKTIVEFRRAIRAALLRDDRNLGLREMCTNLGNAFDTVGRFIEAVEYWNRALEVTPSFGMALGNKGMGLYTYALHLYDPGHACVLLKEAHMLFTEALQHDLDDQAKKGFEDYLKRVAAHFKSNSVETQFPLDGYSLGEESSEQTYRKWCLANRLFLNPLNDLDEHSIAAKDTLCCPPIVGPLKDGSLYQYAGFFNQLVQEYASARYILYQGLQRQDTHFSDRHVTIMNTLDYPIHCLAIEEQKAAFRVAYSILDKIAFFLNSYLGLGNKADRVNLKQLWYANCRKKKGPCPFFRELQNLPLRGLFWLSMDLYETDEGFRDSVEPDAEAIQEVRNCLEHRYLRVHDDFWSADNDSENPIVSAFIDRLEYPMRRSDFAVRALRMLQLSRSALIYLCLGIHREERRRRKERDPNQPIGTLPLDKMEDEWKQ